MPKYIMISRYGNEIKEVNSIYARDELKTLGYREIGLSESKNKAEKPEKIKK